MRAVSFYVPNSTTAEELIIQRIIDAGMKWLEEKEKRKNSK